MSKAVALKCYANGFAKRALREIENAYRGMLRDNG